jgi:prepilin-type N-terminal cleavage/methylation domain-containing protein
MASPRNKHMGFTLLELLVALAIFSLVSAMAAGTFWSVTKAWNRGGEMLEQLHYGEFTMEQLVTALRGAAWFPSKPSAFGFWLEDSGGKASWVTSGTAFLPPDSPWQNGLHRLSVTVDSVDGEQGLVVRAWPHVSEDVEERDVEGWLVCPEVEKFSCEWYDFENDDWSQDWEETNSLPKLLRVTLTMKKRKQFDENLELQRLVELEVAPELPGHESRDRTTNVGGAPPPEENPAGNPEPEGGADGEESTGGPPADESKGEE